MVEQVKKLRITHIDNGADASHPFDLTGVVFHDPLSGRWPKVSFNDGVTLSYLFVTNTKVVFLTGRNRHILTDDRYAELVLEFYASDRDFDESNWNNQPQRAPSVYVPTEQKATQLA